ncbi:fumarylacetoacetate hydrolase family protein [Marinobacter salarius]|uniref:fumarylacetoacetate hydrolase family protein n=1 Tax=Marinobacter salarius TaxID=1420917 RepID=UPI00273C40AD|nr:fumarylacetoacetate hydrolase family protein [Marinobacter salarius]MDP4533884.1 fumarylacetoacetate hydrolase family protein [Marinobacter salarius]
MRIGRILSAEGEVGWALLESDSGCARWIRGRFSDWAPLVALGSISEIELASGQLQADGFRLLAPIEPGARIFGVGLNYLEHLTRLGSSAPPHPLSYLKPESAIVGPNEDVIYPAVTQQLDYEIELVAVVACELADSRHASSCLLGYTIGNDVSARDAGRALGRLDLFTQKAMDRTTPLGPWIETIDGVGGAGQPALDLTMTVNGQVRQKDNTQEMIFSLDEILNYIDARCVLRPGDLVFTGSTSGVGLESGLFLQPGDIMEAYIEKIGTLRNAVSKPRRLSPHRQRGPIGAPQGYS